MTFLVFVSFPFGALDRTSIISVPDHCLFIYLVLLVRTLVCLLSVFQFHMYIYNAITKNNCFVKGSHKYDVYLIEKNKAYCDFCVTERDVTR